uniref:Uncharacterized protein n=1 Tax=Panagrolaimus superbus TaxID=310955 RepID=A0A914XU84_9BILA
MKRTYVRRSDLYSTPSLQRPIIQSIISPSTRQDSSSSGTVIGTNNSNNNDSAMAQKLEALEALVKKVVDENTALQATVEGLKTEVENCNQRVDELETIIKNRRIKVHTAAVFRSTPEMAAANVQVRFSSEIATFFLKDFINFDMENKALEEVGKLIAIKMFEQLIPEGCSLATFSISSTPRYGYVTIPSNLFDELAEKLVLLTQGREDHDLKHAILLRINFGLNDKIQRIRKQIRNGGLTSDAAS